MADESPIVDFTDLKVQAHWYKLRGEFEHELADATAETRKDFDVSVKLNSATIVGDEGRSALRIPISARWRDEVEQTIALLLVTDVVENEVRLAAVAHGVSEQLQRWVEHEIPIRSAPTFLYPDAEVRWPTVAAPAVPAAAAPEASPAEPAASA